LLLRLTDPPVYRPAALMAAQPKVSPAGNCAPPVYRPMATGVSQRQALPPQHPGARVAGGAPPVYRPQPLQIAQPKAAMTAAPHAALQRFVAKDKTVYYPDTVAFSGTQSQENYERSLRVLGGPRNKVTGVRQLSWSDFAKFIGKYELSAMGRPTGGANQKQVQKMFRDETAVHYFTGEQDIQTGSPTKYPLLSKTDMAEKGNGEGLPDSVAEKGLKKAQCVIEILEDFGLNVPDTTTGTVGAWHTYSKGQNLDYRQDNNYIVLYVQKLGCMLISAARTAWNSWNPKRGRYLVATSRGGGGGEVGHMIGVTVDADGDKTITDRQELSPGTGSNAENYDNFYVTYVFKAP